MSLLIDLTWSSDGDWVPVNTSDTSDAVSGVPTAVDDLTITWSRPHALAAPEPGQITLVLRQPWDADLPIPFDAAVMGYIFGAGHPGPLFRGWVNATTRTPPDPTSGLCRITYHLVDLPGRLTATKIGDTPWPEERTPDRIARINSASPHGVVADAGTDPGQLLRARDVDNADLLDVIENTLADQGVRETSQGLLGPRRTWGSSIAWPKIPGLPIRATHADATPTSIPARAIRLTNRVMDRRTMLTRFVRKYGLDQEQTQTLTYDSRGTDSVFTLTTDCLKPLADTERYYTTMRRALMAAWRPREFMDTWDLVPSQLDGWQIGAIIKLGDRSDAVLACPDAPAWIGRPHVIVLGGTIRIRGGELRQLTLTVAPADTAGVGPMRWNEIPSASDLRPLSFRQAAPIASPDPGAPRFADFALTS